MPKNLLESITEKDWQESVINLALMYRWTHYHTYRSTRSPSGFPDLVLVRERIIFAELKTEKGRLTATQEEWLGRLKTAGGEVYLWRPRDLEDVAKVLSRRMAT